ncbi:nuclear transport factor 2 family protein [Thetidibacter halocola]|uniref:Nuclear transport factor 2 family protein n=1 Tax=Thetidibacter halocola TaxID=2827239 RepID=A0A8J7WFN6_9RHOB|nr:nuclear transport factor 2 family protein [Thetidibacter halocola]MBS0124284.1 nuclear transport factor 2 family protein [Thetidibacter halocola]
MSDAYAEVLAAAHAYGEAVYHARPEVFETLCHDRFNMTMVGPDGFTYWDKAGYLARVSGRQGAEGEPSYEILGIDVAGGEIARVHLWVDVPPLRYEDHLGFVREGGSWKLLTKVFRTMARLDERE